MNDITLSDVVSNRIYNFLTPASHSYYMHSLLIDQASISTRKLLGSLAYYCVTVYQILNMSTIIFIYLKQQFTSKSRFKLNIRESQFTLGLCLSSRYCTVYYILQFNNIPVWRFIELYTVSRLIYNYVLVEAKIRTYKI